MIPLELFTMAGGAIGGFAMKYMSLRAQDRKEQFEMAMSKLKNEDNSRNEAVERVPINVGAGVRRLIVVSILFCVILAPFIMTLLGYPIVVEIDQPKFSMFFGIIGGGTKKVYIELYGYLMIPEVRQTLTAIIGFYFGSSAAKV